MIELLGVTKRYDTGPGRRLVAAQDVSVTIGRGEFVGLSGGRVTSYIQLAGGESPASILRRVGQLG